MADQPQMAVRPQTPVLPSTADAAPYVPISWMAVSAITVAGLFLVVLVGLGVWDYFVEKKPLLLAQLLVFPLIAVVLSFAGRRLIRNSEGTRTGENLCSTAWWISVIGGLGFCAYMLAVDQAIRRDAEDEGRRWVAGVLGDETGRMAAFIETLDPDRRRGLSPSSPGQLEAEFRDLLLDFRQCDLVRLAQRNPGDCRFEGGGVTDWSPRQNAFECVYAGKVKCREGVFGVQIPVRGVEYGPGTPNPGRKWMVVVRGVAPMIQPSETARTPYGWLVDDIEQSAMEFGKNFFALVNTGSPNHPLIYHNMVGSPANAIRMLAVATSMPGRVALAGGAMGLAPFYTKESADYFRTAFFKLPGGGEPSQAQRDEFNRAWQLVGLLPPGTRLKNTPERSPAITLGETSIDMHFPCELPILGTEFAVCKCRLVVTLTDPAVLAEFRKLRDEANPDQTTRTPPNSLRTISADQWRLVRVETDLQQIKMQRPQPGQGAGQ